MTVRDIIKNDDYEATSDSDGSSSSDGSDSKIGNEMNESPPATVAVATSPTSPFTQSVLSTPQDVYPIFTVGTQALSTPKMFPIKLSLFYLPMTPIYSFRTIICIN